MINRRIQTPILSLLAMIAVIIALSPLTVSAEAMQSGNYHMDSDAVDFAGARSTSASYNMEDTAGESGSGDSASANSINHAGFQQSAAAGSVVVNPPTQGSQGQGTSASGSYLPINVIDFAALARTSGVLLSWRYPVTGDIQSVRIVRSTSFFPTDINDGDVIFEGGAGALIDQAIDHDVVPGKTYYYAIFTRNSAGVYSSGVLANARIIPAIKPGGPTLPPVVTPNPVEIFAGIVQAPHVDQAIQSLSLLDFEFIQDGHVLTHVGDTVAIDGSANLTIRLAYNKVPEVLKTIAFGLVDPTDPTKVFSFLLRADDAKSYYEATIGPLGKSGIYNLQGVILDYKNQSLKRFTGNLRSLVLAAAGNTVTQVTHTSNTLWIFLVLALLIVLAIALMMAHRRNKRNTTGIIVAGLILFIYVTSVLTAHAAINKEINYQGKLANSSDAAVTDGGYNIRFKLYTTQSGGSPIWSETWCYSPDNGTTCDGTGTDTRAQVKNGLFSLLLGSNSSLAGVNFDQTLYLGVEIGGSGTNPAWDGEMSPRKKLGAVPAAFVAETIAGLENAVGPLQVNNGAISATSTIASVFGGTGISSYNAGDILFGNAEGSLSTLPASSNGLVLKLVGGMPTWSADLTGTGGAGAWATTTDSLAVYPSDTTNTVIIGGNATTSTGNILEVIGNAKLGGTATISNILATGSSTLQNATFQNATGTAATTTNFYSTTASSSNLYSNTASIGSLSAGSLSLGSLSGVLYGTNGSVSALATSSLGLPQFSDLAPFITSANAAATYLSLNNWYSTTTDQLREGTNHLYYTDARVQNYLNLIGNGSLFSTTSATYFLGQNQALAFSTTSASYFLSQNQTPFSTTSATYFLGQNQGLAFSTTSVSYFLSQNQGSAFSTTSASYFLGQNQSSAFSTTSAAYFLNQNQGASFSTTSTDYWLTQKTTDNLTQGTTNKYYADSLVNTFVAGSTTILKTYSNNTFTGSNTFNGSLTIGSLNGPLQANNGLVSATTSIGVHYGGTGLTAGPALGQLLVGNSTGGYSLTATSSLGLPQFSDLASYLTSANAAATYLSLANWYGTTSDQLAEGTNHLYYTNGRVQTYLNFLGNGQLFSTTSAAYFLGQNQALAFSTTSASYFLGQNQTPFSTTSATYFLGQNQGLAFSTTSANAYISASSTIAHPAGGATGNVIQWDGTKWISVATSTLGITSGTSLAYPFGLAGNATSTLTQFNGGLTAYASTTIGNGTGSGGLTISGNATTTGGAYFAGNVSVGARATAGSFTATSTAASIFPNASTTQLSISKLYDSTNSLGSNGFILQTNGSTAQWIATSTLGLLGPSDLAPYLTSSNAAATYLALNNWYATTTDGLKEGTNNLYWTNARFDARLSATTSLPNLKTLLGLTDVVATRATTTNATTTSLYISGPIRGAGLTSCSSSSDKLIWDAVTGQFACGADAGAGGGITAIGAQYSSFQTGSSQTLATGTPDANIGLTITSSGDTHTFTPTWTGILAANRGGTGISNPSAAGILLGSYAGGAWQQLATSSLGLPTFATLAGYVPTSRTLTINGTSFDLSSDRTWNIATAAYPFGLSGNATSTLTQFNGGLTAYASTTIGNGTQKGGLTIAGGATTTGSSYLAGTLSIGSFLPNVSTIDTNGNGNMVFTATTSGAFTFEGFNTVNGGKTVITPDGTVSLTPDIGGVRAFEVGTNALWGNDAFAIDTPTDNSGGTIRTFGQQTIGTSYFNNTPPTNGLLVQGNVGIGTTSPFAKLSVAGQVVAANFVATTTAANIFPNASTTQLSISKLYDSTNSLGSNGSILQTNGSTAQWVATSTLGFIGLNDVTAYINASSTIAHPAGGSTGNVIQWDGTKWVSVATSSLGFGTGSGSVTSVDASGGTTGLAFTGGPIVNAGTLTLSGVLNVANGGTGWNAIQSGFIPFGNGASALATSSSFYFDSTNSRLGLGTTSPWRTLSVNGSSDLGTNALAGSFTATDPHATSTFAGSFNVGNGAIYYNADTGTTSIQYLETGNMSFAADSGIVSWIDMPVTSASANGVVNSYSANLNGNPLLTIFGISDGSGSVTNTAVGIGTTSPYAKLSVAGQTVAQYFTATSTTIASTFPLASTTALSASAICLSTDCRTAWPTDAAASSTWATTTSQVAGIAINYSKNNTDVVSVGSNSTTTAKFFFDPNQQYGYFSGKIGIGTTSTDAIFNASGVKPTLSLYDTGSNNLVSLKNNNGEFDITSGGSVVGFLNGNTGAQEVNFTAGAGNYTDLESNFYQLKLNNTNIITASSNNIALGVNASTTVLSANALCLSTDCRTSWPTGIAYPFGLAGNATSTLTQFNGGLTAYASSTIGNGLTGLTVNGNATTTGNAYFAGKIGIGTSTVADSLDVAGTQNLTLGVISNNTAGTALYLNNTTSNANYQVGVTGTANGFGAGNFVEWDQTHGQSSLLIASTTGNVLLGGTLTGGQIPGSPLSVVGGTSIGSSYVAATAPSNGLIVQGNIGVGTTSPYAKLSVDGRGVFNQDVRANFYTATSTTIASTFPLASTTALSASAICFSTDCRTSWAAAGAAYPFGLAGNATSTLTQFNGGLTAYASSTIGNGTQKGGLTINGGATTTGNLIVGNFNTSAATIQTGSLLFQPFALNNSFIGENTYFNGSHFVNNQTGNAGLFYFLGNEGQFRFSTSSTVAGADNNLGTHSTFKVNGDGSFGVGPYMSNLASDYTGANFVVNSVGNVGIGSSSPDEKLVVTGDVGSFGSVRSKVRNTNANGFSDMFLFNNASNYFGFQLAGATMSGAPTYAGLSQVSLAKLEANAANFLIGTSNSAPIVFETNANERARIDSTGNFGIGTTSPYAKLSVAGQTVSQYFTSTSTSIASTFPYASTTALSASSLFASTLCLSSDCRSAWPTGIAYPFGLAGNATSTLTQFNGGLTAFASSTIGTGTQAGGLTINGGATTTGTLTVLGTGTTTLAGGLIVGMTPTGFFSGGSFVNNHSLVVGGGQLGEEMVATGIGSIAFGFAHVSGNADGTVQATSRGSLAGGAAQFGFITSSGFGSVALGYADSQRPDFNYTNIVASGDGSFAGGHTQFGSVIASGSGSFFYGEDGSSTAAYSTGFGRDFQNNQANSFMVGYSATPTLTVNATGVGIGTTSPWKALSVAGDLSLAGGLYDGTASAGQNGYVLQSTGSGVRWVATSTLGITSGTSLAYPFGLAGNATSTLTQFNGGLTAYASSTIGDGTQTGGLTISGAATTTGNAYFAGNVAVGATGLNSSAAKLEIAALSHDALHIATGDQSINAIAINNSSFTSAFNDGLNLIQSDFGFGWFTNNNHAALSLSPTGGVSIGSAYSNTDGGAGNLIVQGNIGIGTTSPYAKLSVDGRGVFNQDVRANYFTSTSTSFASTFPYASTTALSASAICFSTDCRTSWAAAGAAYPFGLAGNATSTLTQFNGGLTAFASSTIGTGTQAGGLTINGGATTTGNAYFGGRIGIGTSSPSSLLTLQGSFPRIKLYDTSSGETMAIRNDGTLGLEAFGRDALFAFNATTELKAGNNSYIYLDPTNGYEVKVNGTTRQLYFGDLSTFSSGLEVDNTADQVGLLVKGFSGQASDLLRVNNSSNATLLNVTSAGNFGLGTTSPYAKLSVDGRGVFNQDVRANFYTATSTTVASTFPLASTTALSATAICFTGDTCRTTWPTGAGGAAGTWSTTTSSVTGVSVNYSNSNSDVVAIGSNSTTTADFFFDPNTQQAYLGSTTIGSNPIAARSTLEVRGAGAANPSIHFSNPNVNGPWTGIMPADTFGSIGIGDTDRGTLNITGMGNFSNTSGVDIQGNLAPGASSAVGAVAVSGWMESGNAHIALTGNQSAFTVGNGNVATLAVFTPNGIGFSTTSPWRTLSVNGSSDLGTDALAGTFTATSTTIASTFPLASTTALSATAICFTGDTCRTTWPTGSGSLYPFGLAGNATSTLTQFNGGLTAFASSTIGSGAQNGGLTINGGATTTGNAYFGGRIGIASSSPYALLSIALTDANIALNNTPTFLISSTTHGLGGNFPATTTLFGVFPNNHVAIGTSSPMSTFSVQADSTFHDAFDSNPVVAVYGGGQHSGITLNGGISSSDAQPIIIQSAQGQAGGFDGGDLDLYSGLATTGGFSGNVNIKAANAAFSGFAGNVLIDAGAGGLFGELPGNVLIGTVNKDVNVGIGTTSPYAKLSVAGQTVSQYFTATSTTIASTFPLASTTALSATAICFTGDTCRTTWPTGSGSLYPFGLAGNATSTLTQFNGGLTAYASSTIGNGAQKGGLTVNGGATTTANAYFAASLGIGATSPIGQLDVGGFNSGTLYSNAPVASFSQNLNNISSVQMQNISSGTSADSRFSLLDNGGTSALALSVPGTGNTQSTLFGLARSTNTFMFENGTRGLGIGTLNAADLTLGTNNAANVTIKSGGNVGIGSTSPSSTLSVSGNEYLDGNLNVISSSGIGNVKLRGLSDGFQYSNISFGNAADTHLWVLSDRSVATNNHGLLFATFNGTSFLNTANFKENGDVYLGGNYDESSNAGAYLDVIGGNVGIGTTSPYAKLSVAGQTVAQYFTATSTTIASTFPLASTTALSATAICFTGDTCRTTWPTGSGSLYPFGLAGNATSTLTQFNGGLTAYASSTIGNGAQTGGLTVSGGATTTGTAFFGGSVGIGTAPSLALHVNSASAAPAVSGTATGQVLITGNGTFATVMGVFDNGTTPYSWIQSQFRDNAALTKPLVLQPIGNNVGIASTSPWGQLSVNSSGLTGPEFVVGSSTRTNFIVANSGNVGIGTTLPATALHVNGASASPVSSGNATGQIFVTGAGTYATVIGTFDNGTAPYSWIQGQFRDNAGLTNPLDLQPVGGNVGLGTSSPYAKLSVDGRGVFNQDVRANYFTATSTTIASTFPLASTTALSATAICFTGDTCRTTWPSAGGGAYPFGLAGNATSTLTQFNGGVTAYASSTIGNGNLGLTVSGNSTTTGNAYIAGNLGIGTTTPASRLEIVNSANIGPAITIRDSFGAPSLEIRAGTSTLNNAFIGTGAAAANTTGNNNTAFGAISLAQNTTGVQNAATGYESMFHNTSGFDNTASGYAALLNNTTGNDNSGFGWQALQHNTTGSWNAALGGAALGANSTGSFNVGVGWNAGYAGQGDFSADVFVGYKTSWNANSPMSSTTELGYEAGYNYAGNFSTLLGYQAGYDLASGNGNIALGANVDLPSNTGSNQLNVGNLIYGTGVYSGITPSSAPAGGKIGIGTTTPWRTLSVNGSSDLGINALAGYFTATSTTIASTFPLASTTALSATAICFTGDTCRTTWPTGGGGSGGGTWATTSSSVSGQLVNYSQNNSDIVAIGSNSTSTAKFFFDPNLQQAYLGSTTIGSNYIAPRAQLEVRGTGVNSVYFSDPNVNQASTLVQPADVYGNIQELDPGRGSLGIMGIATFPNDAGVQIEGIAANNLNPGIGTVSIIGAVNAGPGIDFIPDNKTVLAVYNRTLSVFNVMGSGFVGIGTTSPYAALSVVGGTGVVADHYTATSTSVASTFTYASTTVLSASTICISTDCRSAWPSGGGGAYPFGLTGNATSTLTQFNGGLTAFASSTIGNGTQLGGLTINGGATTTGNAYFGGLVGIGTTTPYSTLSVNGSIAGSYFNADNASATSTFSGGLNVGNGGLVYNFSSGVTSIAALNTGNLNFDTDAGVVSWVDLPVDSTPSAGTVESYSAQIGSTPVLTLYGEADGSGGIQKLRAGVGTTTPYAKLAVTGNTGSTNPVFAVSTTTSGGVESNVFRIESNGTFTTNTAGATSTINGNLYVNGTLRGTNVYSGDLIFKNGFRFTEADPNASDTPSGIDGLYLKNQDMGDLLSVDKNGNMTVSGDICTSGNQCYGKSISALASSLSALASSTAQASSSAYTLLANQQTASNLTFTQIQNGLVTAQDDISSLKTQVSLLASSTGSTATTSVPTFTDLTASTTFVSAIADAVASSTTASVTENLATSTSFVSRIADAVKSFIETSGEWVVAKLTAKTIYADRIETQVAAVTQGLEMTDSATGQIYCIRITNGNFDKLPGPCGTAPGSQSVTQSTTGMQTAPAVTTTDTGTTTATTGVATSTTTAASTGGAATSTASTGSSGSDTTSVTSSTTTPETVASTPSSGSTTTGDSTGVTTTTGGNTSSDTSSNTTTTTTTTTASVGSADSGSSTASAPAPAPAPAPSADSGSGSTGTTS